MRPFIKAKINRTDQVSGTLHRVVIRAFLSLFSLNHVKGTTSTREIELILLPA